MNKHTTNSKKHGTVVPGISYSVVYNIGCLPPTEKIDQSLFHKPISRCTGHSAQGSRYSQSPNPSGKSLPVEMSQTQAEKAERRLERPKGDRYETTDQLMIEVLLMSRHHPVKIASGKDAQLVFTFEMDDVWPTIENILSNHADTMMFSYQDWWRAKTTWQMNLRQHSQYRGK
jgi:hypothetical protein